MATVFIPPQLRELTGGADRVEVEGGSLKQVIAAIDSRHPGIEARLRTEDQLADGIAVTIDGRLTNRGLLARVEPTSEVHFLPAIGGG